LIIISGSVLQILVNDEKFAAIRNSFTLSQDFYQSELLSLALSVTAGENDSKKKQVRKARVS
jgi:hypothetical protein